MKRSINKKVSKRTKEETAAILCRLSRDDNLDGESYSIANQKLLLERTARELGYTDILTFVDDGITGTTMNRKGLNQMTEEINKGMISAVLVKDLSRLGRDYVGVGQYLDFLSENNVRFVAVSDNIDTDDGDMEMIMLALKNVLNECYAADISKKVRTVKKMQGNMGVPLSLPPYGYMKNPENPKVWIIDNEAAKVVRRIFDMTLDGKGIEQIARQLESEKIMTPKHYMFNKGIKKAARHQKSRIIGDILRYIRYSVCVNIAVTSSISKPTKNRTRAKSNSQMNPKI